MKKRKIALLCLAVILILACNLPASVVTTDIPTPTFTPIILVAVNTPTATLAGSTVPFAAPSGDPLNCRTGPSTLFPAIAVLSPGQSTEIVAKNPEGTWWKVKNPQLPGGFCWISAAFSTVTGDISGVVAEVGPALPPTSTSPSAVPGSAGVVNSVHVSMNPDSIHVGGCMGPIQPVSVSAKIGTTGAIKIKVHFKDEQTGSLSTQDLNFKKADIQDVSDSFTPPLNAGTWKLSLVVEGIDVSSLHPFVTYKITC